MGGSEKGGVTLGRSLQDAKDPESQVRRRVCSFGTLGRLYRAMSATHPTDG